MSSGSDDPDLTYHSLLLRLSSRFRALKSPFVAIDASRQFFRSYTEVQTHLELLLTPATVDNTLSLIDRVFELEPDQGFQFHSVIRLLESTLREIEEIHRLMEGNCACLVTNSPIPNLAPPQPDVDSNLQFCPAFRDRLVAAGGGLFSLVSGLLLGVAFGPKIGIAMGGALLVANVGRLAFQERKRFIVSRAQQQARESYIDTMRAVMGLCKRLSRWWEGLLEIVVDEEGECLVEGSDDLRLASLRERLEEMQHEQMSLREDDTAGVNA